jgi:hypothetical protein
MEAQMNIILSNSKQTTNQSRTRRLARRRVRHPGQSNRSRRAPKALKPAKLGAQQVDVPKLKVDLPAADLVKKWQAMFTEDLHVCIYNLQHGKKEAAIYIQ